MKHAGIKAAVWVKGRTTSVGCLRAVAVDWSEQACVGYSGAIVGASIVTGHTRNRGRTNSLASVKQAGIKAAGWVKDRATSVQCLRAAAAIRRRPMRADGPTGFNNALIFAWLKRIGVCAGTIALVDSLSILFTMGRECGAADLSKKQERYFVSL